MPPLVPVLAVIAAALMATPPRPAQAFGDRDALSDETIGLMIDDSGPGQAEALLGVLYLRGMRIESDPIAASAWLDRAARSGHPAGIYGAARMHADGIGVPVDAPRARELLRDADPVRFGPLADAVRRLRHDLGLPEAPVAATPKPDPDAATPLAEEAKVPAAKPAVPDSPTDPTVPGEPASSAEPVPVIAPAPAAEPARSAAPTEPAPQAPAAPTAAVDPVPVIPVPTAEVIAGPFAQLATLFSEASTSSELARIRSIVPSHLLQGHELSVRSVRLGDGRTAWRIVATGFAHRDEARIFCGLVVASGLGCLPRQ